MTNNFSGYVSSLNASPPIRGNNNLFDILSAAVIDTKSPYVGYMYVGNMLCQFSTQPSSINYSNIDISFPIPFDTIYGGCATATSNDTSDTTSYSASFSSLTKTGCKIVVSSEIFVSFFAWGLASHPTPTPITNYWVLNDNILISGYNVVVNHVSVGPLPTDLSFPAPSDIWSIDSGNTTLTLKSELNILIPKLQTNLALSKTSSTTNYWYYTDSLMTTIFPYALGITFASIQVKQLTSR